MPEKIRTLTIEGWEYNVSNLRGIINPGKFEGESPHAVRDHNMLEDYGFGESEFFGYYRRVGHRFYREDSLGFVTEISAEEYASLEASYSEACERDEALEEAQAELTEAESEETGSCDSCEAAMINGVRCHEHGCPRYARLKSLRSKVASLEEAY